MGRKTGTGLTAIQYLSRTIQFSSAALILGIYSYFLAALKNHHFTIATSIRAVEGISGIAALYALLRFLFLCFWGGGAGTVALPVIGGLFDMAFVAAFIYVAVENKGGAGTCRGVIDTPFGKGNAESSVLAARGFTSLPSFHVACQLQTASLAVAIIAIFFFLVSIFTEIGLVRNRNRESRYAFSLYNSTTTLEPEKPRPGWFASWSSLARYKGQPLASVDHANMLPEHVHPDQLDPLRPNYAKPASTTYDHGYAKYETGYEYHGHGSNGNAYESVSPQPYHYEDGIYERHQY